MSPLLAAALSVTLLTQDPSRLIVASNVRLRSAPAETADVVASVPLGTVLVPLETGGDGAWVRLRMADGRDGWTPSRLTRKFTAETKVAVFEALIKERIGRSGDSFPVEAALVEFIERARTDIREPEASGRLAWHWLTAMSQTARHIAGAQPVAASHAAFLAAHRAQLVFNTAGTWMLKREVVLAEHDREKDTSTADDIAWFAVTNGLSDECENFVPCVVRRADLLQGEYLRRHSAGRRVGDALTIIGGLSASRPGAIFDRSRHCGELLPYLASLRGATAATRAAERQPALDALDKLRAPCAGGARP